MKNNNFGNDVIIMATATLCSDIVYGVFVKLYSTISYISNIIYNDEKLSILLLNALIIILGTSMIYLLKLALREYKGYLNYKRGKENNYNVASLQ